MDFLALPRRDLQALCKRNGVRANMTNAAMAEALAALPTVDGIGEYVKEPVTVPAPEVKAAAAADEQQREKQGSPLPRGRRVTVKAVQTDLGKEDEKRESAKEDAPAVTVGRRGPSRRARPATALAEPAGKVTEEEKAPQIPSDRHVKLNDEEEDKKAAMKPEEEEEAVPALGVGHRGACLRIRCAPAVSGKVAAEDEPRALALRGHGVPVKSAEVIRLDDSEDEEKEDTKPDEMVDEAPAIRVGWRGASQRAPAPADSRVTRRRTATSKVEAVGVTEEAVPMRATCQRKPTVKAAAAAEEKALPKVTRRKAVKKTISQQEEQENPQDVEIIEHVILMEETPAQELLVTDQESMDHSTLQGQQVGVEKCPAPLASQEDSPIMDLVSMVTGQAAEKEKCANFQDGKRSCGSLDKGVSDKNHDAFEEMEMVSIIQGLEASPIEDRIEEVLTDDANHESEMQNFNEVKVLRGTEETCKANAEDDIVSQDKEDINIDELQADLADGSVVVDFPGNIKLLVEEETNEINTEDGVSFQEKGNVAVDMALPEAEAIPSGCSIDICCVEVEKAGYITSEMSKSPVALDEDGEETNQYVDICHADKPSEVLHGTEETSKANAEDDIVSQDEEDINIDELQANLADGSVLVDCSGNIKLFVEEETDGVSNEDGVSFQEKGDVAADMVLPYTVVEAVPSGCSIDISCVEVENAGYITSEMSESPTALNEVGEETNQYADICHADKPSEVVIGDSVSQVTVIDNKVVQEEKVVVVTDEMPWSTAAMHEDVKEDQFQNIFIQAANSLPEVKMIDCEVEEKTSMIIDEQQQSLVTIDEDVLDNHLEIDAVHADEHKEVVTIGEVPESTGPDGEVLEEDKAAVITKEVPQSTSKMDEGDEGDQFQTVVHDDQVVTADSVLDLKITDCEPIEEDKTTLITDEKQQSTVTMDEDVVDDHFETDAVHADEHNKVVTVDEVPELTGTDGEVVGEGKVVATAEELPQSTCTDEEVEEDQFQTFFVHEHKKVVTTDEVPELTGIDDEVVEEDKAVVTAEEVPQSTDCEEKTTLIIDEKQQSTVIMDGSDVSDYSETDELKEVATDDKVPQLTGTEGEVFEEDKAVLITDEDHLKESAFTSDLPQEIDVSEESEDCVTPAPVDDATESLSNSILTVEPVASVAADAPVCKDSIEKNTTELVAMQDEKVVKVNKKSVDWYAFSLRQLKTKLKERLNAKKNKEAKRVALARVDENVCRSHTKGQQQNLNLQQH